jgi:4-amino-4-deoxy-L-arabinose transferase-like glycosyltransferase
VATLEFMGLAAIALVSAVLQGRRLELQGIGNPYYAATVRSMLEGLHPFFFASFDPAGFVAVDKPPLGFWVQAVTAKLLGYGGLALLLPQALATVGSVVLLWRLVRRPFGPAAGLMAALALALTPIAVATGRTNTIDPLLVLLLLGSAWALLRAVERDASGWLLLSALLIGLGFNVKMLQAYLVVPAWGFAYLVGNRTHLPRRVVHLALATGPLLAVSFSWATVVQLTPPEARPYVGSSSSNSPFDLAFGYNGLQRLLPASLTGTDDSATTGSVPPSPGAILGAFGAVETGERGPLRLFNRALAAQITWLLPLAVVGLVAAWWQEPGHIRFPLSARRTALLFWGGWLLTGAAFFSVANQFHRYYLVMLAPPIAALAGAGLASLWADWRRPGLRGWLLPLAVAGTCGARGGNHPSVCGVGGPHRSAGARLRHRRHRRSGGRAFGGRASGTTNRRDGSCNRFSGMGQCGRSRGGWRDRGRSPARPRGLVGVGGYRCRSATCFLPLVPAARSSR